MQQPEESKGPGTLYQMMNGGQNQTWNKSIKEKRKDFELNQSLANMKQPDNETSAQEKMNKMLT